MSKRSRSSGSVAEAPKELSEPETIGLPELARRLSIPVSSAYKLLSAGKLLGPVARLGRRPLWSLAEVRAWIAAGMPRREIWEKIKGKK